MHNNNVIHLYVHVCHPPPTPGPSDNHPPGMVLKKAEYMGKDIRRLADFYQIPEKTECENLVLYNHDYHAIVRI